MNSTARTWSVRSLLDVNMLVALGDVEHPHHILVQTWMQANASAGWATCPITQNGFLRIAALPSNPRAQKMLQSSQLLSAWIADPHHAFWPDDVSILNTQLFDHSRLLGHGQITDAYLLALAVKHGGRFVTLDRRVTLASVRGAQPEHLVVV